MKTFEEIALDKLKEIQPASLKDWSFALGYKSSNAFYHTFKKLMKEKKVIQINKRIPAIYQVKDNQMSFICAFCGQESTEKGRTYENGEKSCKKCDHHHKYLDKVMKNLNREKLEG